MSVVLGAFANRMESQSMILLMKGDRIAKSLFHLDGDRDLRILMAVKVLSRKYVLNVLIPRQFLDPA